MITHDMVALLKEKAIKYNRPDIVRLMHWAVSQYVANIIDYQDEFKDKPTNYLEIGTYKGASINWTLTNLLTHPNSIAYCIDPWSLAHDSSTFGRNTKIEEIEKRFMQFAKSQPKLNVRKGFSEDVLRTQEFNEKKQFFDLIYIDGEHDIKHVLQDFVLSWPLLKVGGIMVFDDYEIGCTKEVQVAVDCILLGLGRVRGAHPTPRPRSYQLLFKNKQVGIRKTVA